MADDAKMMRDLEAVANSANAPKKEDRPAFGPGSGPQRGRRRGGAEVAAAPPPRVKHRDENVPNPVGTLVLGLVGLAVTLIGLLTISTHLFVKMRGFFEQHLPNFGYAIVGVGFYLIAKSRWRTHKTFQVAYWKNRRDPHAWKLPLIWTQGFMLNCMAIYTIGVGIGIWTPATNLVLLTLGLIGFLGYLLWYLIASFKNRFPSIAGLRIAMVGFILAVMACLSWIMSQFVMVSLIFGFFALVAASASISVAPFGAPGVRGSWLRALCILLTVLALIPIAVNALPYGKPQAVLADLGPAVQGLSGEIGAMDYSADGSRLAVTQQLDDKWFLRVVDASTEDEKILKVPAGEAPYRPVFVMGGRAVVIDSVRNGVRNLWRVDASTGKAEMLTQGGVEPLGEGTPWSEISRRFLYVVKSAEGGYSLVSVDPAQGTRDVLLRTPQIILSPSWTRNADQVAYVLATQANTAVYVMDLADRKQRLLVANDPDAKPESLFSPEADQAVRKVPFLARLFGGKDAGILKLYAVVPSADGFRYLYLARQGGTTSFWSIMPDGSKRKRIYQTTGNVRRAMWSKDGHKIYFEEDKRRLGFILGKHSSVRQLDADTSAVQDLIAPQVSHHSPALSPDGVKVAFAGRSGLWYPSSGRLGIWVAVLR